MFRRDVTFVIHCIDVGALFGNNIRMFLCSYARSTVHHLTRWDVVAVTWLISTVRLTVTRTDRFDAWGDRRQPRDWGATHRTIRAVSLYSQWQKEWLQAQRSTVVRSTHRLRVSITFQRLLRFCSWLTFQPLGVPVRQTLSWRLKRMIGALRGNEETINRTLWSMMQRVLRTATSRGGKVQLRCGDGVRPCRADGLLFIHVNAKP